VPFELFGTCTITVRVNPFTLSDKVVEPGDAPLQPDEWPRRPTSATRRPKDGSERDERNGYCRDRSLTKRAVMQFLDCPFTTSPSLKKLLW